MVARCDGFMLLVDDDTWIADSGASACMIYNKNGFIKMKEDARQIKIGDGRNVYIQKSGKWQGMIKDKPGKPKLLFLDEVCYVLEVIYKLMLLTKALKNGWTLSRNNQKFSLKKMDDDMIFIRRFIREMVASFPLKSCQEMNRQICKKNGKRDDG
jgi:hypothetical protein